MKERDSEAAATPKARTALEGGVTSALSPASRGRAADGRRRGREAWSCSRASHTSVVRAGPASAAELFGSTTAPFAVILDEQS